ITSGTKLALRSLPAAGTITMSCKIERHVIGKGLVAFRVIGRGYRRVCESATRLAGTRKGHLDHRSQERLARERRRRETAGDARGERSTNQKLSTLYP